jgi:hypothetical protein
MAARSVLIVSPHFPPINAPDHQRVRMALTHFREFGWEPVILAVAPEFSENSRDDSLLATIPLDTEIHRVSAVSSRLTRTLGIGNFALRSLPYLRSRGNQLLSSRSFDLVFFSTSIFPVMSLGPVWRKRFDVPYVLDFQDPWVTDYYRAGAVKPPGGKIKYAFANFLGRTLEPRVVREAAHIVVVSAAYTELLRQRYPELVKKPFTVLPFAAATSDFDFASESEAQHGIFDPGDGFTHWVYAGAAGPIMEKAIRAFFSALQLRIRREPQLGEKLRIHFVGTDYAGTGRARRSVEPLALEYGLEEIIDEQTDRLPFLVTLKLLADADALLIFGSDDPSYTASKVFPYIMARKPLLVIVHDRCSVADIIRKTRAGSLVTFTSEGNIAETAAQIDDEWFGNSPPLATTDWQEFERYSAHSMTATLSAVFTQATCSSSAVVPHRS